MVINTDQPTTAQPATPPRPPPGGGDVGHHAPERGDRCGTWGPRPPDPRRPTTGRQADLTDGGTTAVLERIGQLARDLLGADHVFTTVVHGRRAPGGRRVSVRAGALPGPHDPPEQWFCQHVAATARGVLVQDARTDPLTRVHPAMLSLGLAWAGFPVRSADDGHVVGAVCVVAGTPRHWGVRAARALEALADTATEEIALRGHLEAARAEAREALEYAEECALLSRTLQQSLLPPHLPHVPGMDLAAAYLPGGRGIDVLGDFYDVVPTTDGGWSVFIGDVSGKGAQAARTTGLTRYTLRALAREHGTPSVVLTALNEALLDWFGDNGEGRFVTVTYATLRPVADGFEATVSTGGHAPALLRRRDGRVESAGAPGTLLGCFPDITLTDQQVPLASGDSLVLHTDGVTEARRAGRPGTATVPDLFGERRLGEVLARAGSVSAAGLVAAVHDAVLEHTGAGPRDDMAVLTARAA